jgi:hypothetical protein
VYLPVHSREILETSNQQLQLLGKKLKSNILTSSQQLQLLGKKLKSNILTSSQQLQLLGKQLKSNKTGRCGIKRGARNTQRILKQIKDRDQR